MTERSSRFSWKETVAAGGVVLSLIFVGFELRQNTLSLRASALNEITDQASGPLLTLASDGELADAYARWRDGTGELTAAEDIRVRLWVYALLRNAENVFLQTSMGAVDSLALRGYGFSNTPTFRSPAFPSVWRGFRDRFHPDFVAAFEASYNLTP